MGFTNNLGPISDFPGVVDIKPSRLDIQMRNDPEAFAYTIWGSKSVNDLYGNPTGSGVGGVAGGRQAMFTVNKGSFFRSQTILEKKWGSLDQIIRGTTRAMFDLEDFIAPASPQPLPLPNSTLFLRSQQSRLATGGPAVVAGAVNNGEPILGPIVVIPPFGALGMLETTMSFTGTAPILANSGPGDIPSQSIDPAMQNDPYPMGIALFRPTTSLTLTNLDGANSLLYSFDWDMPFSELPSGENKRLFGSIKYIILGAQTGAIDWVIDANLGLGASAGV